ncbi:AAA family ATPase [Bradyrhizobium yuanmingense]|uniref:AAA family ATPase n=1 Tax=Bradyrhizobium yuanmingense TaxID=108015 RepID=UPI0013154D48|nr:AAA family ATPase [Bradyrhizobium yuanmingense]
MAIIENIRLLKGAAVLAERKATTPSLDLKRYNLFYGFNGSGKSTLSRILAKTGATSRRLHIRNRVVQRDEIYLS